jgi:hypothetical protein
MEPAAAIDRCRALSGGGGGSRSTPWTIGGQCLGQAALGGVTLTIRNSPGRRHLHFMHLPARTILCRLLIGAITLGAAAAMAGIAAHPQSGKPLLVNGQPLPSALDLRFTPLRDVLPRRGVIGYATTQPVTSRDFELLSRHRYAQYVLAPLLLDRTDNHPLVLADFPDAASLAEYLAQNPGRLRVLHGAPDGLAVLERTQP